MNDTTTIAVRITDLTVTYEETPVLWDIDLEVPNGAGKCTLIKAIERVSMTEYAGRQISELSGGQQQRSFLARAPSVRLYISCARCGSRAER